MQPPVMQPAGPPGVPPQQPGPPQAPGPPMGAPPGMMPNPAYAQWAQAAAQVQAVQAENARRQKQFDDAVALIRSDGVHGFRLDIETDSTIAPDEQAEKQARIEFMQQFIPLLETVVPVAQGNPAIASLAKEATLFAVRGFPVARGLEEAIEQAFDQIGEGPPNPKLAGEKGTQQNPQIEAAKVQADVQDTQVKARTDMAAIAQKQQQAVLDAQVSGAKLQAEEQRAQAQMAMQAAEIGMKDQLERARLTHMAARNAQGLV